LAPLRAQVTAALRDAGFTLTVFEDLGGRDEDAERAYLDGVARSDIYGGRIVPFVPFTKLEGEQIVGTHNN